MSAPAARRARGGLPPRRAWLIDPEKEKFPTPVDDRGLVIVDQLVDEVKQTLDLGRFKMKGLPNTHHLYWEKDWYKHPDEVRHERQHLFRNLGVHRLMLPPRFHNWLHKVTIPPPVPTPEVMEGRIETWQLAQQLFNKSRSIAAREYKKQQAAGVEIDFMEWEAEMIDWEYMTQTYEEQFATIQTGLAQLATLEMFPGLETTPSEVVYRNLAAIATHKPLHFNDLSLVTAGSGSQ